MRHFSAASLCSAMKFASYQGEVIKMLKNVLKFYFLLPTLEAAPAFPKRIPFPRWPLALNMLTLAWLKLVAVPSPPRLLCMLIWLPVWAPDTPPPASPALAKVFPVSLSSKLNWAVLAKVLFVAGPWVLV